MEGAHAHYTNVMCSSEKSGIRLSNMEVNDPKRRLVELVDAELKTGASKLDVARKLQELGMDEVSARSIVAVVDRSRSSHKAQIARFALGGALFAIGVYVSLYYLLGREALISLTWPLFGLFVAFWGGFITLEDRSGVPAANARRILSYSAFLASSLLSGALMLHSDWLAQETINGASWRYYILKFMVDAVYFIGPKVFAFIFLLFALASLLVSWAEFQRFKSQDYGN